ncbi:hypothetical protein CYY_007631 [Polysphondylium violaceum]|uniref:Uncharacterized protein n=1 Tax=Polysphondylium violaceum TaxID=133409 RepID=A0A8J4UXK8_9MYCE|nr:hypothetical protein CYY_007631 [Polysphondylium violaceum]
MTTNTNNSNIQITISDASEKESISLNQLEWDFKQYRETVSYGGQPDTPMPSELSYDEQVESFKNATIENMQFYKDLPSPDDEPVASTQITPDEIIAKNINTVYCKITYLVQRPIIIKISFNRPKDIGNYELLSLYARAYQYVYGFFPTGNKYQVFGHALDEITFNGCSIIKILDDGSIACEYSFDS